MQPLEHAFRVPHPVDLRLTLGPLAQAGRDPTVRIGRTDVWRATRTPAGPASMHIGLRAGEQEVTVRAWGPGAPWVLEAAPDLVGASDDGAGFEPRDPVVAGLARRFAGLRIPRTRAVMEALVPAIISQKVTGMEARRAYKGLVGALAEPAPGPPGDAGLSLPPDPARLAAMPYWAFHRFGVERKRADTVRRAAAVARRLEGAVALPGPDARRLLQVLPGIGPWTAAVVGLVALGDADAVPVGDFHFAHQVSWALAGEPRGSDERMLELLEPYRGHRGRVIRLIVAGGHKEPSYGPRMPVRSIARI